MTEISDRLTIQEEVEIWRKSYEENVKPWINKGKYKIASLELDNIIFLMSERREDLILGVHCGLGYMSSAQVLKRTLETAESIDGIKFAMEQFEAYQAQTRLLNLD